jgi:hypothetical protein
MMLIDDKSVVFSNSPLLICLVGMHNNMNAASYSDVATCAIMIGGFRQTHIPTAEILAE